VRHRLAAANPFIFLRRWNKPAPAGVYPCAAAFKRGLQTDSSPKTTPENSMKLLSTALLTAALLGGCASMTASSPAKVADGVLVGPNGMTLYVFDRDTAGQRQVRLQRPLRHQLAAPDGHGRRPSRPATTRSSHAMTAKKQWAMKGKPLYYWAKDAKPGDKTGDNVRNGLARRQTLTP
jgi:predicted lipoprotein with Yx(FWY)xxD motif